MGGRGGGRRERNVSALFFFRALGPQKKRGRQKKLETLERGRKRRAHVEVKVAGLVAVLGRDLDGGAGTGKFLLQEEEKKERSGRRKDGVSKRRKRRRRRRRRGVLKSERAREGEGRERRLRCFGRIEKEKNHCCSSPRASSGHADRTSGAGASRCDERGPRRRKSARARHGRGGRRERSLKREVECPPSSLLLLSFFFFLLLLFGLLLLLRITTKLHPLPPTPALEGFAPRACISNSPRGRDTARALRRHGARGQEGGLGRGEALHGSK